MHTAVAERQPINWTLKFALINIFQPVMFTTTRD